jgi:Fe-S-cluster-containing hydrogenase component 2
MGGGGPLGQYLIHSDINLLWHIVLDNAEKTPVTCLKCKESGHVSLDCPLNASDSEDTAALVECLKCKNTGHISLDCPTNTPEEKSDPVDGPTTTVSSKDATSALKGEKDLPIILDEGDLKETNHGLNCGDLMEKLGVNFTRFVNRLM